MILHMRILYHRPDNKKLTIHDKKLVYEKKIGGFSKTLHLKPILITHTGNLVKSNNKIKISHIQ